MRKALGASRAWARFNRVATETGLASVHTIRHRSKRLGNMGVPPSRRDQSEMMRMGTEKAVAAAKASGAVRAYWQGAQHRLEAIRRTQEALQAAHRDAHRAQPTSEWLEAQAAYVEALAESTEAVFDFWEATFEGLTRALKPYHERARANARRLDGQG
jgi:hypothetical protein